MFTVIVDIIVKPDCVEQFRTLVIRQGQNSLTLEADCQGFDILQNPDDPAHFTLYETYTDAAAFHEVHRSTPHFAIYAAATEPLVLSKSLRALTRIWPED